jgi:hypothetical protein
MLIMADEFRRERAKIFIKVGQWEKALPQINDYLMRPSLAP